MFHIVGEVVGVICSLLLPECSDTSDDSVVSVVRSFRLLSGLFVSSDLFSDCLDYCVNNVATF